MGERSTIHAFNDGADGDVARRDDETYPVIVVSVSLRYQYDRNQLGRAGQKMLEPGERREPMRSAADEAAELIHWFYTASQIADKASDQARLDRNRQRGATGSAKVVGSRRWMADATDTWRV
ncbi:MULTISPECIES: hypothetical protein [unclassified Rhodococcus (in: high G+C Gram-positive bacteria)]|uniref:hypothetical protein n=1 Tax=unclassified Rhodococcus (in: high G+C Gram-positive bacteria) TaxID=192944 RepID=UPI003393874C